ncbi:MAG: IS110 family transposase, partial [Saonia sp.]
MNKYRETFGVDIGKDVFDVHGSCVVHSRYRNDESWFKKLLKGLPRNTLAVIPFSYMRNNTYNKNLSSEVTAFVINFMA